MQFRILKCYYHSGSLLQDLYVRYSRACCVSYPFRLQFKLLASNAHTHLAGNGFYEFNIFVMVGASTLPPLMITPTFPSAMTDLLKSAATPNDPDGSTTSFIR